MESTFRKSMAWLHTWAGVVISSLLFVIFWMGTLSVFDREIDRWMMPATRLAAPAAPISLDAIARPLLQSLAPKAPQWTIVLPNERVPTLRLSWREGKDRNVTRHLDPATGAVLPEAGSRGGTGFIFPFHFRLHIKWLDLGYWLVGLAGMAMLVLLLSGVVIHRKIFAEFFTFRPRKHLRRSSLDLHNLTGVVALPFHFVITLSGLIIFFSIYFPSGWQAAYHGDRQAFNREAFTRYSRPNADTPGALGSLDAMVTQAQRLWGGGMPSRVGVRHPGDANAYVEVHRSFADRITMTEQTVYFDAATGAVLAREEAQPVRTVQRFISGLHFIQFERWTLRWLYFLAGLSGCVMIATGFLFWLEARRAQHAKKGLAGVRVVEALTAGSVTGIVIATVVFFIANRLLPLGANFAGFDRAELEMWAFYLAWIATFAHAWQCRAEPRLAPARRAWREQCWAIGVLSVLAVALNWLSTGDHLLLTLGRAQWAVAGMDLMLLASAGLAVLVARRLREADATQPVSTRAGERLDTPPPEVRRA